MQYLSNAEREIVVTYLSERFGLSPHVFKDFVLLSSGRKVWAARQLAALAIEEISLTVETAGLPLLRWRSGREMKLTTAGARVFGCHATRNCVYVSHREMLSLLQGNSIEVDAQAAADGYVILYGDYGIIGVSHKKGPQVMNMLPRARQLT